MKHGREGGREGERDSTYISEYLSMSMALNLIELTNADNQECFHAGLYCTLPPQKRLPFLSMASTNLPIAGGVFSIGHMRVGSQPQVPGMHNEKSFQKWSFAILSDELKDETQLNI